MSGATPIRLPLSRRQAEAVAKWLPFLIGGLAVTDPDEVAALREVAEKLATLKDSR